MLDVEAMRKGFEGLVVPEHYIRKLLPAINAGRTVLLFGPPGNGKTTLVDPHLRRCSGTSSTSLTRLRSAARSSRCSTRPCTSRKARRKRDAEPCRRSRWLRSEFDERWVACRRPVAMAGGETDARHARPAIQPGRRFYDAPLHVKALNGMFLIDDFGRQKFAPNDLLNRWIVPMETQFDFLKLSSGASFSLPFDLLLMFSTNLQPSDLMDPAFLRRIQYKIKLFAPSRRGIPPDLQRGGAPRAA